MSIYTHRQACETPSNDDYVVPRLLACVARRHCGAAARETLRLYAPGCETVHRAHKAKAPSHRFAGVVARAL